MGVQVLSKHMKEVEDENRLKEEVLGEGFGNMDLPRVIAVHKDVLAVTSLEGFTVVYIFGAAMDPNTLRHVAHLCNNSSTVDYVIYGMRSSTESLLAYDMDHFTMMNAPYDLIDGTKSGQPLTRSFKMANNGGEVKMFQFYRRISSSSSSSSLPEDKSLAKMLSLAKGPPEELMAHLSEELEAYQDKPPPTSKMVECGGCGSGFMTRKHIVGPSGTIIAAEGQKCGKCCPKGTAIATTTTTTSSSSSSSLLTPAGSTSGSGSNGNTTTAPPSRDDGRFKVGVTHEKMATNQSCYQPILGQGVLPDEVSSAFIAKYQNSSDKLCLGIDPFGMSRKLVPSDQPLPLLPVVLTRAPVVGELDEVPADGTLLVAFMRTQNGLFAMSMDQNGKVIKLGAWSVVSKNLGVANLHACHRLGPNLQAKIVEALCKEGKLVLRTGDAPKAAEVEVAELRKTCQEQQNEIATLKEQLASKKKSTDGASDKKYNDLNKKYDDLKLKFDANKSDLTKVKKEKTAAAKTHKEALAAALALAPAAIAEPTTTHPPAPVAPPTITHPPIPFDLPAAAGAGEPPHKRAKGPNGPQVPQILDDPHGYAPSLGYDPEYDGPTSAQRYGLSEGYMVSTQSRIHHPQYLPHHRSPLLPQAHPHSHPSHHSLMLQHPYPQSQHLRQVPVSQRMLPGGATSHHMQSGGIATHYHQLSPCIEQMDPNMSSSRMYALPSSMHAPQSRGSLPSPHYFDPSQEYPPYY